MSFGPDMSIVSSPLPSNLTIYHSESLEHWYSSARNLEELDKPVADVHVSAFCPLCLRSNAADKAGEHVLHLATLVEP